MDQTRWMAGVARRRARVRCLHQWMGWLMMGCAGLVMLAGLMERPFGQSRDLAALMGFGGVGMAWVVLTIWPVLAGAEYLRWPRDRWMAARLIGLAGVMIALVALGLVALM